MTITAEPAATLPATLSILLLEHDAGDAALTCASLGFAEGHCRITRVDNGRDFEDLIRKDCFDLILAEYSLPSFDGISALRMSKQHCPETPFIFVSGALGEELAIETLKQGATDYVLKHRLERLRPAVLRALSEKEARVERQRAQQKLRELAEENARLLEESRRASSAKDEFIAMISHELRSPMTSILGWTRMLKLGDLSEEDYQAALNALERSATVQAQLVEDLLDVSRISTGKLTLDFDNVNLADVVIAASDAIRVAANDKKIEIVRKISGQRYFVRGDRNRLQQVIVNLLQNAVKFTPERGRVEIGLTCTPVTATVSVTDNGVGIRPEFLPHLFEPFSQDETGRQAKVGLGLGLSIVRHIVERHGGSVAVDSRGEGYGATFSITLPLLKSSETEQDVHDRGRLEMPDLSGTSLMVVEDDMEARGLIVAILARCGAQTVAVSSVDEARPLLTSRRWDVIITDIAMPQEDGYVMIAEVKRRLGEKAPPVIALTAFGAPEARKRIAAEGFAKHLMKPIDPFIFARCVAESAGR